MPLFAIDLNPFDDIVNFLSTPFAAAAGWAWDTVVGGITDWLAKGFVQLVTFVWSIMDRTTSPTLTSEWFSGSAGAPYLTAVGVATGLLGIFLLLALIQGVLQGRPMELVKRLFLSTPAAVAGILFTVGFAQVAIDLCDSISNGIWDLTRDKAVNAVDGLLVVSTTIPAESFLAPLVLLLGMIGMLMLWIVLFVREALVYLVVALAPLAWATSVWPALASVRRRTLELLAGLIVSKIAIAMALAVGLGALGGLGATGQPGDGVVDNGLAEFSTLVTGIIVFGLAAFMPFLVIKLVPIVEAAVIAQGIHSAPLRTGMQGMQYSYYLQGVGHRLAGTGPSTGSSAGGASTVSVSGAGSAGSASNAASGAAGGAAAAGAVVAPVLAGVTVAASTVASTASAAASAASGSGTPPSAARFDPTTAQQTLPIADTDAKPAPAPPATDPKGRF
ncbi:MAG: hypothetical protein R2715_16710 [Ilumatobacteraceae bacterium]